MRSHTQDYRSRVFISNFELVLKTISKKKKPGKLLFPHLCSRTCYKNLFKKQQISKASKPILPDFTACLNNGTQKAWGFVSLRTRMHYKNKQWEQHRPRQKVSCIQKPVFSK